MLGPVAVLGITSQRFTNQVFRLRKQVRDLGYEESSEELLTVPHLTLSWKKDFDLAQTDQVKEIVEEAVKGIKPFFLEVNSWEIMDQNIAAKFDNSYSRELAKQISAKLKDLGFELVVTDHMKLIRSKIKPEYLEEVKRMVEKTLPTKIEIISIALAGHLIREEDICWQISF